MFSVCDILIQVRNIHFFGEHRVMRKILGDSERSGGLFYVKKIFLLCQVLKWATRNTRKEEIVGVIKS